MLSASPLLRRFRLRRPFIVFALMGLFVTLAPSQAVQVEIPPFGKITCVAFHPNNKILALCGHDKAIRLWDYTLPREVAIVKGHTENIQWIAFSPDGKFMASAGSDKVPRVWDVRVPNKVKQVAKLEGHTDDLLGIAFSSNSRMIASCGSDNSVRIWDISPLHGEGAGGNGFLTPLLSPPNKNPAVVVSAGVIKAKFTLQGHTDKVWSVAFSKDDKVLASCSSDKKLKLWDMTKSPPVELSSPQEHDSSILSLAFSADGKYVVTGALDQKVIVWDVTNPREPTVKHTMSKHERGVYCVAISNDGKYVASGSSDQKVHVWDISGAEPVMVGNQPGHQDSIESVAFSPDSKVLASASNDRTIRLWNVTPGSVVLKHRLPDAGAVD